MRNINTVRCRKDICDKTVKNEQGENLGVIEDVVLDKVSGHIAYAVLKSGSVLGLGGKFFALPWKMLHYDDVDECFIADIHKDRLENAPGFDKDHWPDMSNREWNTSIHSYYGSKPYWDD